MGILMPGSHGFDDITKIGLLPSHQACLLAFKGANASHIRLPLGLAMGFFLRCEEVFSTPLLPILTHTVAVSIRHVVFDAIKDGAFTLAPGLPTRAFIGANASRIPLSLSWGVF